MEKEELPKKLGRILACPICKAKLNYSRLNQKLTCTVCKTCFDVEKGIPIMTVKAKTQKKKAKKKK